MKKILLLVILFLISLFYLLQALSQNLQPGLPEDINGYKKWTRLNKKIIRPRESDPHRGFKRIYVNREKSDLVDSKGILLFPYKEGTIIVKEVRETRKRNSKIVLVSIMRKIQENETTGGWDFIEYSSLSNGSFKPINFPKESCYACHQGASESDSVWTRFDNF